MYTLHGQPKTAPGLAFPAFQQMETGPESTLTGDRGAAGRPLRVLHLTLAADAGGLSRYITTLGTALTNRGVEVIAAGDDGSWRWAFDEAPFPYLPIPLKQGLLGLR